MSRVRIAFAAVALICTSVFAQDWPNEPIIKHSTYQAVNGDGSSAYGGAFPIRLRGVVLNNTEDWLDPTPAYDSGVNLWRMGGQAELYVQTVDESDFGGTAAWMGQYYGNHIQNQDPVYNYTDPEWQEELGRLNLFGGTIGGQPVAEPIRAGDLVEIRVRGGLHYLGKMNVNEQHDNDYDRADDGENHDFELVILHRGYGLPEPTPLALSDMKLTDDTFIFDPTRQTGGERHQSTLVELTNVWLASPGDWSSDSNLTVTDGTRTFNVYLGLNASFDGTALFDVGQPFNVTGILDQKAAGPMNPDPDGDGVLNEDGYQILAMDASAFEAVPEPTTITLVGMAVLAAGYRRRRPRRHAQRG